MQVKERKIIAWNNLMRRSAAANAKDVSRWTAAVRNRHTIPPAHYFVRDDGSVASTGNEMFDELRKKWGPIFNHVMDAINRPSWEKLIEELGEQVFEGPEVDLGPLDPSRLYAHVHAMPDGRAASLDNWRTREVKALPPFFFGIVARIFTLVEAGGEWPRVFSQLPQPFLR